MTKRERVISAINGDEVDYVPSSFSLHFEKDAAFGKEGVQSHLDFFKATDTDILKIMNENLVPYMGEIRTASDYSLVQDVSINAKFMKDQLELTKNVLDKCETEAFTMATLHGVTASAIHPLEKMACLPDYDQVRNMLCDLLLENPKPVLDGMKRITDGMCELATEYIKMGIDGVYYAALGGEHRFFNNEQFHEWIEPLDLQILRAIREAGGSVFLHICKDALDMGRYQNYVDFCDVINWGIYEAPFTLEEGRNLFSGKTIMGGLKHRSGVLVDGTCDDVRLEVEEIINKFGKHKFILGADCTLATDQDLSKVLAAVQATRGV